MLALPDRRDSRADPNLSPVERAVRACADCLVLEGGRVPDAPFDALRTELDDTVDS